MILDGKKIREQFLEKSSLYIKENNLKLTLAIIYIGDDKPSELYVNNKIKYCKKVGINTKLIHLDGNLIDDDVINIIKELNNDNEITGMILQSPIPENLNFKKCISYIDPKKDVDGLTAENFNKLANHMKCLHPCTPKGIMNLLEAYNIDVESKNVCIIGRGQLVGKPLFYEMLNRNATVFMCHSKTKNLKEITKISDIIVCGVGKPNILTADMVKKDAIVIDAGITVIDGKIKGDVDFENLKDKCSYITPNPGGVGPMTISTIIENLIKAGSDK